MAGTLRLLRTERSFGFEQANRLLLEAVAPWVQDLGLLVEGIEVNPPQGTESGWQPGAIVRLPFSRNFAHEGHVSSQAMMALSDTAMMLACSAAWDGYRPMMTVDQAMHFVRPASSDILADARVVRVGRTATLCQATLLNAADRRPVAVVTGSCAAL